MGTGDFHRPPRHNHARMSKLITITPPMKFNRLFHGFGKAGMITQNTMKNAAMKASERISSNIHYFLALTVFFGFERAMITSATVGNFRTRS